MMVVSTSKLFLLALFSVAGTANAKLKVEVTPVNSYAMEYSSLQITCTAYDEANVQIPESIRFIEVDDILNEKNLTDKDSNLNFTTTREDNGRKLIVTMTILNVTKKYELGKDKSYRCVANAVNISRPAQFVFHIYVIQESDIPKVTVSKLTVDHSVSATIFCNITFRGSQTTTLKSLWLSKDGKNLNDTLKEDGISESTSLVLKNISMKDGGMYSCNLKVLLKDKVPREIKETSSLTIKPWFESKDEETVAKKLGDDLTLKCGARGYPLKVEWKFKSETDETVKTCIGKFELDIIRKNFYCLSFSGLVPFLHSISR
nr:uncharacterized protein LOC131775904 [Pocillopora verrucosa]